MGGGGGGGGEGEGNKKKGKRKEKKECKGGERGKSTPRSNFWGVLP